MTQKKKVFQILAAAMLFPGSFVLGLALGLVVAVLLVLAVWTAIFLAIAKWCFARTRAFFASFRGSVPKTGTDDDRSRPASSRGAALRGDHVPLPEIVRIPRRERWLQ